jgi:hypothetical protein
VGGKKDVWSWEGSICQAQGVKDEWDVNSHAMGLPAAAAILFACHHQHNQLTSLEQAALH